MVETTHPGNGIQIISVQHLHAQAHILQGFKNDEMLKAEPHHKGEIHFQCHSGTGTEYKTICNDKNALGKIRI